MLDEDAGAKIITERSIHAVARICGFGVDSIEVERSASGLGRHFIIHVDCDLSPMETVCLQALMGSDLKRETLNFARVRSGVQDDRWNLLYDKKVYPWGKPRKKRKD